jgi:hypothetical protein
MIHHMRRMRTNCRRFMCRVATVARPIAVRPAISVAPSAQAKCSVQTSRCGWKRGTFRPEAGSGTKVRSALNRLHVGKARQRFSKTVSPPEDRGAICSNSKVTTVNSSAVRQYAQQFANCARISRCRSTGTYTLTCLSPRPADATRYTGRGSSRG